MPNHPPKLLLLVAALGVSAAGALPKRAVIADTEEANVGDAAEAESGECPPNGQSKNRLEEKAETAGREEEELLWSACTVC